MMKLFEAGWQKSVIRGAMLGAAVCGMLAARPGPLAAEAANTDPLIVVPSDSVAARIAQQLIARTKSTPSCCAGKAPKVEIKKSCCGNGTKCSLETNGCDGTKECCGTDHCTCKMEPAATAPATMPVLTK